MLSGGDHFLAWLGLVPNQRSGGERHRLFGISKRGDRYLRTLMIHGALRAASASERRGRGARQQECSHRLGHARREFLLRTGAIGSGGLTRGGSSEDVRKSYLAIATT